MGAPFIDYLSADKIVVLQEHEPLVTEKIVRLPDCYQAGRSWIFRYMFNGKPRTMGLGPADDVSLADARRKAKDCRSLTREGIDPIDARQDRRQRVRAEAAKHVTFRQCAERYIEANKAGWRSAKHLSQWRGTLETYVYPVLGQLAVDAVDNRPRDKSPGTHLGRKTETASAPAHRDRLGLGQGPEVPER